MEGKKHPAAGYIEMPEHFYNSDSFLVL